MHFLYQHAPLITPTKCTLLISTKIKWASPTCFGTCVPLYHLHGEHNASS